MKRVQSWSREQVWIGIRTSVTLDGTTQNLWGGRWSHLPFAVLQHAAWSVMTPYKWRHDLCRLGLVIILISFLRSLRCPARDCSNSRREWLPLSFCLSPIVCMAQKSSRKLKKCHLRWQSEKTARLPVAVAVSVEPGRFSSVQTGPVGSVPGHPSRLPRALMGFHAGPCTVCHACHFQEL